MGVWRKYGGVWQVWWKLIRLYSPSNPALTASLIRSTIEGEMRVYVGQRGKFRLETTRDARLRAIENQANRLRSRQARLRRTSDRISWLRLAIFFGGLVASAAAYQVAGARAFAAGLLATALVFGIVVYFHRRIHAAIAADAVWLDVKTAQVARAQRDWSTIPAQDGSGPDYSHPFEADLDLYGGRSVHRLIDTAASRQGSRRLRAWLAAPVPDPAEILSRQSIVRELAPRVLFRDRLAVAARLAAGPGGAWDAARLSAWLECTAPAGALRAWLVVLGALALLDAGLFVLNRLGLLPPLWQLSFVVYFGLMLTRSGSLGDVFGEAAALEAALRQLLAVFRQLEGYSYRDTPHLRTLCAPLLDPHRRPSRFLARVARIVAATGVRGNPAAWFVLNALVPWDVYFAYVLNGTKSDLARYLPAWMDVWFDLEALDSLAEFAYLNPAYTFPTIAESGGRNGEDGRGDTEPVFEARSLGHPLIPDGERVTNDYVIAKLGQVDIITGSNMSGKSTFLRTVGANVALALAGGPCNATYLRTLPFRLFTCLKVSDSVTDGISYFYAEVKRLKALLVELEHDEPLPLLFLIDEIFRGTNNRERLIGSQAYVRALIGKNGAGLISTHDLELVRLAAEMPGVRNDHFRDAVMDGRMVFDYILRPGPSPTTNALAIMRIEGLPVPPTELSPPG